jgi:hypothetical protein
MDLKDDDITLVPDDPSMIVHPVHHFLASLMVWKGASSISHI